MVFNYTSVHTMKQTLIPDMKNLIDEYIKKTATEEEVKQLLAQWKKTSAILFLDMSDGMEHPKLTKRIRDRIGSRRSDIVQTFLNDMK